MSDKGAAGQREDISGQVIRELLEKDKNQEGYQVTSYALLPDDRASLEKELIRLCDVEQVHLVLTTGGTGFSLRDVTPEATMAVADRNVPGIAEAMRLNSMNITKRAMLSRGVSVLRKGTLIINLPGSPKAVRENLEYILDTISHGLDVLSGEGAECARV